MKRFNGSYKAIMFHWVYVLIDGKYTKGQVVSYHLLNHTYKVDFLRGKSIETDEIYVK